MMINAAVSLSLRNENTSKPTGESGDGHERERALRAFAGSSAPNSFFLLMAVRRFNDWVPQVIAAARDSVPRIASSSNPGYVVEALFAILPYWTSWGRIEDSDKNILLGFLVIDKVAETFANRLISSATGSAARILSQACRAEALDPYLREIASKALQPSARAKAYRSLLDGKVSWFEGRKWRWTDKRYCEGRYEPIVSERPISKCYPFLEVLKDASVDKSAAVRRVAGEFLIKNCKNLGSESVELANLLAADPAPSVSERGKFALSLVQGNAA
jgi:hypothetical protein